MKQEKILVCLSTIELEQIEKRAEKSGMNRSEYIRESIRKAMYFDRMIDLFERLPEMKEEDLKAFRIRRK